MNPEILIAVESKDIPLSYLGEFARLLLDRICREVLGRAKLSAKERSWFEGEAQTFDDHFKKILAYKDKQQQEVALRAVASALCLSYYHAGGPQILREIKGEFQKERIQPANDARSTEKIREIVERIAKKFWGENPSYKIKPYATARKIYDDVMDEVDKINDPRAVWRKQKHNATEAKEKAIERIAKLMPRP